MPIDEYPDDGWDGWISPEDRPVPPNGRSGLSRRYNELFNDHAELQERYDRLADKAIDAIDTADRSMKLAEERGQLCEQLQGQVYGLLKIINETPKPCWFCRARRAVRRFARRWLSDPIT